MTDYLFGWRVKAQSIVLPVNIRKRSNNKNVYIITTTSFMNKTSFLFVSTAKQYSDIIHISSLCFAFRVLLFLKKEHIVR